MAPTACGGGIPMIRLLITITVIILGITALLCALMFWVLCKVARDEFEDE
jgi:hypothetical protein